MRRVQAAITTAESLHVRAVAAVATSAATISESSRPNRLLATCVVTLAGLKALRDLVTEVARRAGVREQAVPDFVLAVQELMTNAIRHGGGRGRLRMRQHRDALVCTVTDRGPGMGRHAESRNLPSTGQTGGRGLFLARELTDSMVIDSSVGGLSVTVTMNL